MKKRVLLVMVLAVIIAEGVFAQSRPPAIARDKVLVNAGIGFGMFSGLGSSMGIPPIKLAIDFLLPDTSITLGGLAGIRSWSFGSLWGSDYTLYQVAIGARGMYHFNAAKGSRSAFLRKLDPYLGLSLGYVFVFDNDDSYLGSSYFNYFLWGINAGARYFFTKGFGMYLELGYSDFDIISVGLTFKF
jgi:hypothetical protein